MTAGSDSNGRLPKIHSHLRKLNMVLQRGWSNLISIWQRCVLKWLAQGKGPAWPYEGTSSGFEGVAQVPATFKIKMIIKTTLWLIQNVRVFLSCWIIWHFPGTHPEKEMKDPSPWMFLYIFTFYLWRHPSVTMLLFKIKPENDLRDRKKVWIYTDYF